MGLWLTTLIFILVGLIASFFTRCCCNRSPSTNLGGMDVLAVKQACKFAKEHALNNGPIILEMDTYRSHGHSTSDSGSTYCTHDKISGVRQERDPIERIRNLVLSHELATAAKLKVLCSILRKLLGKKLVMPFAQAKGNPMPESSELFTNIYSKGYGAEVLDFQNLKSLL